jgi:pyridoxal biosynthesis lyase PdxS
VRVSEDLGDAMVGIETSKLADKDLMQTRGW